MKSPQKIFVIVLVLLSTELIAQSYGLGDANLDLFSKYRVPETSYSLPRLGATFRLNSDYRDYPDQGETSPYKTERNALDLSLSPKFNYLYESEEQVFSIYSSVNSLYSDSENKNKYFSSTNSSENSRYVMYFSINPSLRKYFSSMSSFSYYIEPTLNLQFQEINTKQSGSNLTSSSYYQQKRQIYNVQLGMSFGRIRNVTPVISAIRYQQRMKQLNLLNNDLSDEALLDISQKFSQYNYYGNVYERSDKYFWNDLENIVKKYVPGYTGLNEYASAFLHEVPNELRFIRKEGYMFSILSEFDYDNTFFKTDNSRDREENFYFMPGVEFIFYRQLSLFSQFEFMVKATGGPNLTESSIYKQKYELSGMVGYNYELTDRLVGTLSSNLEAIFMNTDSQAKELSLLSEFNLTYFLEDNITINTSFLWEIYEYKNLLTSPTVKYNIKTVELGLTYHFNRGFIIN